MRNEWELVRDGGVTVALQWRDALVEALCQRLADAVRWALWALSRHLVERFTHQVQLL